MAWYPFDLQMCGLRFKPFGNSGEYVRFVNRFVNYYEKMDLSKYYIKQWKFYSVKTNTGAGVEGMLEFIFSVITFQPFSFYLSCEETPHYPNHSFHSLIASLFSFLSLMFCSHAELIISGRKLIMRIPKTFCRKLSHSTNCDTFDIDDIQCCIARCEIEDSREINHYGKSRSVKADDEETTTYGTSSPGYGFDKNLVSVKEQVQDKALREYYSKVKLTKGKQKVMNRCILFSRKIKPFIAIVFITVYWVSGLLNYQKME